MSFDEYETLPSKNVVHILVAGAMAGIMEHCVMYPLDSVKTRMQSLGVTNNTSVLGTLRNMVQHEGILRPVRGISAVVAGAGPAHAFYFSTYEFAKDSLGQITHQKHSYIVNSASGCLAAVVHDGISNPTEVVKQRLQMYNSPYRGVIHCVTQVYRTEGMRAFYRSYATQLTMNVPFQSIHFTTYELMTDLTNKERKYNPLAHMLSGAMAGAVAAAITTPLDVCKTVLNTQEPGAKAKGFFEAVQYILRIGGPSAFLRGLQARVLYQMPATAICWSTYEFFKYFIRGQVDQEPQHKPEKAKPEPKDKSINLRLVLPQAALKADATASSADSTSADGIKGLKAMELPAVNSANLYGTLSLNTMHHADCQAPTLRHT